MRTSIMLALLLTLVLTTALAGDAVPTKAALERDLVLETTLTTPKTIQPGEPVSVRARIVNRSKTVTYKLVKPGDGSECGWREPHVFFTAETIAKDGTRTAVPEGGGGRCGLYDANWHDEVVSLKPGAHLELYHWMPTAHLALDFRHAGPVELSLHYRYTRGAASKGRESLEGDVPGGTGPMGAVPRFELVSAPLRFEVVRRMDVRLEVKKSIKVGEEVKLSDLIALHIENLSKAPVPVSGAEVVVQVLQPGGATAFFASLEQIAPTVERKTPALAGGATRTWADAKAWSELSDWRLKAARAGSFKIVASWRPTGGQAYYRSEYATVRVRAP